MSQDDYYYEIQLTNKQLVFYFLAGAIALVLSFLAGVMVGRGVESGELQAATPAREARIVAEETPRSAPPPAEELTYARTLEAERPTDGLERPRPGAATAGAATTTPAAPTTRPAPTTPPSTAPPATAPPATRPAPTTTAPPPPPTTARRAPTSRPAAYDGVPWVPGNFSIQVGAFKDRGGAETVMARLKERGYPAYVMPPGEAGGLFNVRVGSFTARADAERIQARLRDEEDYRPFIVRQQ